MVAVQWHGLHGGVHVVRRKRTNMHKNAASDFYLLFLTPRRARTDEPPFFLARDISLPPSDEITSGW
jgi:hypothetical protein